MLLMKTFGGLIMRIEQLEYLLEIATGYFLYYTILEYSLKSN